MVHLDSIIWDKPTNKPRSRAYAVPLVTFERDRMSFNRLFVEAAGLVGDNNALRFQFVDVTTSAENFAVGLRFHNELRYGARKILATKRKIKNGADKRPDAEAGYSLGGFRVKTMSLYTAVQWLADIAREECGINSAPTSAQFTPVYHTKTGVWVVQMRPTLGPFMPIGKYQEHVRHVDPYGVYAFYNAQRELLYVGEGRIGTRLRDHLREGRFAIAEVRFYKTDSKAQAKAMEDRILLTCNDLYGNGTFLNIKRT